MRKTYSLPVGDIAKLLENKGVIGLTFLHDEASGLATLSICPEKEKGILDLEHTIRISAIENQKILNG